MTDTKFLTSIAAYYAEGAPGRTPLEDVVFVLPNKRSAMFLKKYVRATLHKAAVMPRLMTIGSFVSRHARYPEGDAQELLFVLFDAYRQVMTERGRAETMREFDSFVFWGDMILSDFDDIDRSLVNADDLFRNLRNVKEIQADYLDEKQKEVIRRIWGESRLTASTETFWLHTDTGGDEHSLSHRFIYLWEILADVYHCYHRRLTELGLSSPGMQFREAVHTVRDISPDELPPYTHYAFVGFNDLSTAETLIFQRLKDLGIASFFWDTAPLDMLADAPSEAIPVPLRRLQSLCRHFPMPDDYTVPPALLEDKDISVTSVPSNVGQAKALHRVLTEWLPAIDTESGLNTAVVFPDQSLLMPAILSVPEAIDKVNISMGLPYRTTTFATLFHDIISMQLRARELRGVLHFYYEDIAAVLAHPHIRQIAAAQTEAVNRRLAEERMYNIPAADLAEWAPELKAVFTPVASLDNCSDVADYLTGLFDWLTERLDETSAEHSFESKTIAYFREEVERLTELVEKYGVTMSERTFLHMFERIFDNRALTVNGTPLEGLQMLGVLETRALDFDNVIVLSMNERVFPRKQYKRTMIPGNLRKGFGLPDFDSLEWTYAYSFYRLISRARRVALFYDSRPDGQGNGEVSRYVSQIKYMMPALRLRQQSLSFGQHASDKMIISIPKTEEIQRLLADFRAGGSSRLSASALKKYKACPMCFYLEYVRRMRGSDEPVDYLTSAQFGTAVHNSIQAVFEPYRGKTIDASVFDSWLDPKNSLIDRIALEELVKQRYPKAEDPYKVELSVDSEIDITRITMTVRAELAAERDFYCKKGDTFTFLESEKKASGEWHIADGLDVNFYMSIDRVDRVSDGSVRLVDFKTGDDDVSADSTDILFRNRKKDGIFQLLTYCEAYHALEDAGATLTPVLHSTRHCTAGEPITNIRLCRKPLTDYTDVKDDFSASLAEFIYEIFDPAVPFSQCEDTEGCTYCKFRSMCGRIEKKF